MNIKNYIKGKVKEILHVEKEIIVEIPPRENMGNYSIQCANYRTENLKTPMDVAKYIQEHFVDDKGYFREIKLIGPYVNFYINYDVLANYVIPMIEENNSYYGSSYEGKDEFLLVEHTSINPNAEPHIGRCRNSLIGDFLSNLYQFLGYSVERHYYINDLGKKIALLIIGIETYGLSDDSFSSILDVYVKISKAAKEDSSIDEKAFLYLEKVESGDKEMIQKFKDITDKCVQGQLKIFGELNIHFDVFTHESDYVYDRSGIDFVLNQLKDKGRLKEDELGRYYVDLTGYDIPTKEPVLVLTRSNKTALYPMKDILYTIYKMKRNPEHNFIVLGEDQAVYMQQISAVLDILGYDSPKLVSYSYVLLDGDKMSTSGGTVVLVTEFMKAVKEKLKENLSSRGENISSKELQKLCNASIKFTMLNVSKNKIVNFNLEKSTSFTGESGIYILYSIVRINSILKNVGDVSSDIIKLVDPIEYKIVHELYRFPEVIQELLQSYEPAHLTKYLFNLTQQFSKFYEQINILYEDDLVLKASRIRLICAIKTVLENGLKILGIDTIEHM